MSEPTILDNSVSTDGSPGEGNHNVTVGTVTAGTPVAVTPTVAVVPSTEDWKKRFTGLQSTYQAKLAELSAAQAKLAEYETAIAGMDTERSTNAQKITGLEQRVNELTPVQAQLERLQMIATEFPDLLEWEKDGLLPTSSGDELRTKLTALRAKRGTATPAAPVPQTPSLKGAVPPTPAAQTPQTSKELLDAAVTAMRAGKIDDYNNYYGSYLSSLGKSTNGGPS